MTNKGVTELYVWLTTAWPLVIKPGSPDEWKRAKMRELFQTYKDYDDRDVIEAFRKWTEENDKFPTTKNIRNEIAWARRKVAERKPKEQRYFMEFITNKGVEFCVGWNGRGDMTYEEFVNHPRNKEHLDPEEWERRFLIRRSQIIRKVFPMRELTKDEKAKAEALLAQIRRAAEYQKDHASELKAQHEDLWEGVEAW